MRLITRLEDKISEETEKKGPATPYHLIPGSFVLSNHAFWRSSNPHWGTNVFTYGLTGTVDVFKLYLYYKAIELVYNLLT